MIDTHFISSVSSPYNCCVCKEKKELRTLSHFHFIYYFRLKLIKDLIITIIIVNIKFNKNRDVRQKFNDFVSVRDGDKFIVSGMNALRNFFV